MSLTLSLRRSGAMERSSTAPAERWRRSRIWRPVVPASPSMNTEGTPPRFLGMVPVLLVVARIAAQTG